MALNPQAAAVLAAMAEMEHADFERQTMAEIRAITDRPMHQGPKPEVARVEELDVPLDGRTLQARLYIPNDAEETPGLTLYLHGGGWVLGTLETHDPTARALARASGSAVLSLGYRLAPEHPFPAPLDDCYDALCWARDNAGTLGIDAERLAVAGDSAGANLAAATAIVARDRDGPALRHQALFYPVADMIFDNPSNLENGGGEYLLATDMMRWFWAAYLGPSLEDESSLAMIARHPDLAGLPPATVILAEYDPLRDEGLAYAENLKAAGVPTSIEIAPGMIHGFASLFEAIPDALPYIEKAGADLRHSLA